MGLIWSRAALAAPVLLIGGYELRLWATERSQPRSTARAAHAALREEWVRASSGHADSKIVAAQTRHNSLMWANFNASTGALAQVGTLLLTVSSASQGARAVRSNTPVSGPGHRAYAARDPVRVLRVIGYGNALFQPRRIRDVAAGGVA